MSFWGYALESSARILNMVPTKKVNKILYELWHEKVLNLSYLKVWSIVDFDEIQRQDEQTLDNASEHQPEDEYDDVDPQKNVNLVRRSARIPQEPERYGFYNVDEEHELDIKAIRILIAIAAYYDYDIWQMDVKTAFLNGLLNEDMDTSKREHIPMQPNVDLSKAQGPSTPVEVMRMKGTTYASTVGYIIYAVRCTRPDVAFSQNLTSRYQQNPSESHWTFVKNILKYLRNTKDMLLVYGGDSKTELSVTCYTDASWETNRDDLRSHTGYVFVMNEGTVDWKISKQSTTAISYMETEYIVASEAVMEAIWICKFIYRLGIISNKDRLMDMYCDNTSAVTIANEPGVQRVPNIFEKNITLFEK
uniref:Reverse transcriptase Ty1/copia-type domain-containing protein n=1 Tax=Tanacetum cinerariifolium TaxID=118510 RepID=A0A6L2KJF2_TANCI|nr:hypothetical protein [Tanacetum cinerariifolium]